MTTFSLSGSGIHALTANTTGLEITITSPSNVQGVGRSNPTAYYHVGLIRFSDGTSYWAPVPVVGGPHFIPVPANATSIGYAMQGGAVISVTEIIGGTLFFSAGTQSVETLSDVQVTSIADGQTLQWNAAASKWENATPAGGTTLNYASASLSSPVNMPSANTYYDGPSVSLAAGTWLVIATLTVYQVASGSSFQWTGKLWDGAASIVDTQQTTQSSNSFLVGLSLAGIFVLTTITTIRASAACTTGGGVIQAAALNNAGGNTASSIVAVKIA